MRRSAFLVFFLFALSIAVSRSQVVESAEKRGLTIDAGGMASGFDPDWGGNNKLVGAGTYVDVHFTHWIQIEAEGRWLYWNNFEKEKQSNYLIGPRVPLKRWRKWNFYGKALVGQARMTFPSFSRYNYLFSYDSATCADVAFGGTVDYRLSRKLTVRAADFEYQYFPNLVYKPLKPYGLSMGIAYRVF